MRTKEEINAVYARWLKEAREPEVVARLRAMDDAGIEDEARADAVFQKFLEMVDEADFE